jgi:hypothetical protein
MTERIGTFRPASFSLHPDQRAAVEQIGRDDRVNRSSVIQDLIEREATRRYGVDWRQIVRLPRPAENGS